MASFRSDHMIIRDYITAQDHLQYTQLPEGVVAVLVTHSNLTAKHLDIRLDLHLKIGDVKEKLRTHVGTPAVHQRLILKQNGNPICEMSDDSKMLGFYSVTSGMEIHVIDTDPFSLSRNGGLTDTSLVEKYRLSDEAYDKRKGTMREYIKSQRATNPNFTIAGSMKARANKTETESVGTPVDVPGPESVEGITVGARCEVMPGSRRGTIEFVGVVENMTPGHWVGVRLDEPLGKSDGTVKGVKIFECLPGFGAFVRGRNVKVGDFKVRDILDSDDEGDAEDVNVKEDEDEI